jgi:hypothetical protein
MGAAAVVVEEIRLDRPAEAVLVEHDDVVQALAPNGSDHPFDVRALLIAGALFVYGAPPTSELAALLRMVGLRVPALQLGQSAATQSPKAP